MKKNLLALAVIALAVVSFSNGDPDKSSGANLDHGVLDVPPVTPPIGVPIPAPKN